MSDLATLYLRQGEEQSANEMIGMLRSSTYDEAEANRKVGDVYFRAEKWGQAATAYSAFLNKAGKSTEVLDRLGGAYIHMRDYRGFQKLIEDYQYMPQVEAQTYEQQIFLGNLYFYMKDFFGGIAAFQGSFPVKAGRCLCSLQGWASSSGSGENRGSYGRVSESG